MIRETLCMWLLWLLLKIFGQETVCISAVCALPDPALQVLEDYLREVPA